MKLKIFIRRFIPEIAINYYHYVLAVLASLYYGQPTRKMITIGVTGTKGKTSTANFIWSVLDTAGFKVGLISTANIRIGKEERINDFHMTMPGRFTLHKLLREMYEKGCDHVIVETSSEGIKQWRHKGVYYDVAVFTNLFEEHLSAHGGSFENYKKEKGKIFDSLSKHKKSFNGTNVEKIILANYDDPHAPYFLSFKSDKKVAFGVKNDADLKANQIRVDESGSFFKVEGEEYRLNVLGSFNIYNALPAIAYANELGIPQAIIKKGLESLSIIPGRMEKIEVGQNFTAIVDYAHEKKSLEALLDTADLMKKEDSNIIMLYGAAGGGRDTKKREAMGKISSKRADKVIVSNQDPYYDDPSEIIENVASNVEKAGSVRGKDLFVVKDRRKGIRKALSLAKKNDIVLIVGKGSDQSIIEKCNKMKWDDREVTREELLKIMVGKKESFSK